MIEEWKDVPSYEGYYQVSNLGRVKSLEKKVKCRGNTFRTVKEKLLKTNAKSRGYKVVGLSLKGKVKNWQVHQLVAMAFLNHVPNGFKLVVDHIDNNKLNNELSNLQILTNRANVSKNRKGTSKYVGVCWDRKLNKWKSQIRVDKDHLYLGAFETEIEAANAYKKELNRLLTKLN